MSGWSLRYHFLGRDELEAELLERCLRLRRSNRMNELGKWPSAGGGEAAADGQGFAARRCYASPRDCADADFPRLLEAEERSNTLIGALTEAASLLHRLAQLERSGSGRRLPS